MTNQSRIVRIGATAFLALLAGCGPSLSGSYQGTATGNVGGVAISQPIIMTLSEDSSGNINGSWTTSGVGPGSGVGGTVSGVANGATISPLNLMNTSGACMGNLTGTASVNGNVMNSSVSGQSACGMLSLTMSLTNPSG